MSGEGEQEDAGGLYVTKKTHTFWNWADCATYSGSFKLYINSTCSCSHPLKFGTVHHLYVPVVQVLRSQPLQHRMQGLVVLYHCFFLVILTHHCFCKNPLWFVLYSFLRHSTTCQTPRLPSWMGYCFTREIWITPVHYPLSPLLFKQRLVPHTVLTTPSSYFSDPPVFRTGVFNPKRGFSNIRKYWCWLKLQYSFSYPNISFLCKFGWLL